MSDELKEVSNPPTAHRPPPTTRTCRIIIVNYKTAALVVECLRSLEPEMRAEPGCHVVIVDNASPDDSLSILREAIEKENWTWASVLPLPNNGGFAVGNNAAIRPVLEAKIPLNYFHMLNPDTVIKPGAVSKLLDFFEAHPECGAAGSQLEDPDGKPQCSAFHFHGIRSELERGFRLGIVTRILKNRMVAPPPDGISKPVDWVHGASMMVRREVFEQIGLLDENFFLYYEETDLERRAMRAGWKIWIVPESRVVHLEGASTGVTGASRSAKPVPRYWLESRRRYFRKHYGAGYEFLANAAYAFSYGTWRIRRFIQGKPDPDPPGLWRDFVKFSLFG